MYEKEDAPTERVKLMTLLCGEEDFELSRSEDTWHSCCAVDLPSFLLLYYMAKASGRYNARCDWLRATSLVVFSVQCVDDATFSARD